MRSYTAYQDVLTVVAESTTVYRAMASFLGEPYGEEKLELFRQGDEIGCEATGYLERDTKIEETLDSAGVDLRTQY